MGWDGKPKGTMGSGSGGPPAKEVRELEGNTAAVTSLEKEERSRGGCFRSPWWAGCGRAALDRWRGGDGRARGEDSGGFSNSVVLGREGVEADEEEKVEEEDEVEEGMDAEEEGTMVAVVAVVTMGSEG